MRAPRVRAVALVGAAGCLCASLAAVGARATEPGAGLRFEASAIEGGGFFTSVALAPGPDPTIILAGGNSGYHRSTDLGATSQAHNGDLVTLPLMRLASVAYDPVRPGVVYGAAGNRGKLGGFERSLDDGVTWEVVSDVPLFAGQETGVASLPEHPRSTGSLIAVTGPPDGETIWVATFAQGVMRSEDDGASWEALGLEGHYLRTLALDPRDPDVLYTAAYREGVYVTTDARAPSVTFAKVPGAPDETEELAFVGTTLYAAAGTEGLFRYDGSSWERLSTGVPDGSTWTAITGYAAAGGPVLLAGCYACARDADGHYATIVRSTDGGASWRSVTRPADLDLRVVGTGRRWALADALPGYMLGGVDAIVSQLVSRPDIGGDPDKALVLMAGRGGMWRSTDGGARWAPAVHGLSEANSQSLAIDPQDRRRVYQGAAHFGLQLSQDAFATVRIDALGNGTPLDEYEHPTALWIDFDTSTHPSSVIIGGGDGDIPTVGGVYINSDPFTSDRWEDLGYTAQVPNKQPTSLAVGRDPAGERVIVAAAHPRGGLVRKVGDGPWVQVDDPTILRKPSPAKSAMTWVRGTQTLYFFDLAQGIFRSDDTGITWTKLWAHPSPLENTGAIEVRAEDPATLYVAAIDGLYRLDGANVGSVEGTDVAVTRLGPYAMAADAFVDDEGRLWAAIHASSEAPVMVVRSDDPKAPQPRFAEFGDETLRGTMVMPETILVTDDGTVLVGGSRSGTLRGLPDELPCPAGPRATEGGTDPTASGWPGC